MADRQTVGVPISAIKTLPKLAGTVALVGPPNAGKSTLFNQLTGLRQKTANYPGVTVEKKMGRIRAGSVLLDVIDLPGIYSLSPASLDEQITLDVLLGRRAETPKPDSILAILDATRIQQGMYLLRQLLDLNIPIVVALTMTDASKKRGQHLNVEALSERLCGLPVIPVVATTGENLDALREAMAQLSSGSAQKQAHTWPALQSAVQLIREQASESAQSINSVEIERALIDQHSALAVDVGERLDDAGRQAMAAQSERLFGDQPALAAEARHGHAWAVQQLQGLTGQGPLVSSLWNSLSTFIQQPIPAMLLFFVVMFMVFQAVFAWATPLMDGIDYGMSGFGSWVQSLLPEGMISSLIVDGIIAGVGSVIIFLPQIMVLFLFIILLEDCGYLARSAFLMDRAMRMLGMSGQSVIPLVASFACAVPAIMSTRVIATPRERLATILATPFITCSARLPVYALLIGAFVPATKYVGFNLQGMVLFGLYLLGIFGAGFTALIVNKLLSRGEHSSFVMSLPDFRRPNFRTVIMQLLDRVRVFLRRAGRVIFLVTVIVWALAYFPRSESIEQDFAANISVEEMENRQAAMQLENSFLGHAGKFVEPVFRPLGWDWKVSAAVIAGFPAREIMVAVLGTIYAVGDEADEQTLAQRLTETTWPDGRLVFTLPMVLGMLVFYALCLQCASTMAVMRRETNGWRWPIIAWVYMTGLGYFSALLIFQLFS